MIESMSSAPIPVKIIYDASSTRKRRRSVRTGTRAPSRRGSGFGLVNLIVAGVLCYATWWPAEEFIVVNSTMRTPVEGIDMQAAANMLFGNLTASPVELQSDEPPPELESGPQSRFDVKTTQWIVGATAGGWLFLSTISCCLVAAGGGAIFGAATGSPVRLLGKIMLVAAILGGAWAGYSLWGSYKDITPAALRPYMVGLVVGFAMLGMGVVRKAARLAKIAGVFLLLSAVASAGGLYLGLLTAVVDAEYATILFLAIVFAAHSFWGWVLLFVKPKAATA